MISWTLSYKLCHAQVNIHKSAVTVRKSRCVLFCHVKKLPDRFFFEVLSQNYEKLV